MGCININMEMYINKSHYYKMFIFKMFIFMM